MDPRQSDGLLWLGVILGAFILACGLELFRQWRNR